LKGICKTFSKNQHKFTNISVIKLLILHFFITIPGWYLLLWENEKQQNTYAHTYLPGCINSLCVPAMLNGSCVADHKYKSKEAQANKGTHLFHAGKSK